MRMPIACLFSLCSLSVLFGGENVNTPTDQDRAVRDASRMFTAATGLPPSRENLYAALEKKDAKNRDAVALLEALRILKAEGDTVKPETFKKISICAENNKNNSSIVYMCGVALNPSPLATQLFKNLVLSKDHSLTMRLLALQELVSLKEANVDISELLAAGLLSKTTADRNISGSVVKAVSEIPGYSDSLAKLKVLLVKEGISQEKLKEIQENDGEIITKREKEKSVSYARMMFADVTGLPPSRENLLKPLREKDANPQNATAIVLALKVLQAEANPIEPKVAELIATCAQSNKSNSVIVYNCGVVLKSSPVGVVLLKDLISNKDHSLSIRLLALQSLISLKQFDMEIVELLADGLLSKNPKDNEISISLIEAVSGIPNYSGSLAKIKVLLVKEGISQQRLQEIGVFK